MATKDDTTKRAALSGQPPKPTPPKNRKEFGDDTAILNGIITGFEYNNKLQGTRRIQQYDEMRLGDAHVKASLKVVKLPLLSANWDVEPGGPGRFNQQVADFIKKCLFEMPTRTWQETLTNILLHLDYGVMPFEIIYQWLDDGHIGLKKLAVRHPRTISRWELKDDMPGIEQTTTNGVFSIPMDKLIVFVNEREGDNWEGISILRSAWKHWLFKDKAELIEVMAMERHGLGIPYGKTDPNATEADEQKLDEILSNFRANEKGYVRFPTDFEVGLLDMKAGSIKNPNDFIKRQEWAIMLNVLAAFMQLGSGNTGSWALFKGSNTFFLMALEYVAKSISETINLYLIKKLVDMNFVVDVYPKLTYDKIGTIDINSLTTSLQRAVQTGTLTVTPDIEAVLRDAMDLPEYTGEALVDPAMADGILAELDTDVANMENSLMDEEPVEDPATPEDEADLPIEEAEADYRTMKKKDYIATYGAECYELMRAGAKGVPLSEETKQKISEALKKLQAQGGKTKTKKKAKGKKAANPELVKKQKEVKALREEARQFNSQVRRELLEAKAKGVKMSPEDSAKKELDIFNRKEEISAKIRKVQDEIETIKEKSKAESKPAKKKDEKASYHQEPEATPDHILDMFEAVTSELDTIRNA